ncbi:hypothetical protein AVEN_251294-1 [Araneus ventricosus]|uniref:Uncharacterized protein n=1 Tax=Araneus ventricosus TaxID=182803 RepID=A0A4Y2J3J0_ARAVE|nr:hypothetical protein AVEN_251294-1 [Araneus ventricosus]
MKPTGEARISSPWTVFNWLKKTDDNDKKLLATEFQPIECDVDGDVFCQEWRDRLVVLKPYEMEECSPRFPLINKNSKFQKPLCMPTGAARIFSPWTVFNWLKKADDNDKKLLATEFQPTSVTLTLKYFAKNDVIVSKIRNTCLMQEKFKK